MTETTISPSGWMTAAEVAVTYPLSENALALHRHRGTGPRFSKRGRSVRYHVSDIEAWLREGMTTGGGAA